MPAQALQLTDSEREFLVQLLHTSLRDAEVEEHRTRTLSYRELVLKKEDVIRSLLHKLEQPAA